MHHNGAVVYTIDMWLVHLRTDLQIQLQKFTPPPPNKNKLAVTAPQLYENILDYVCMGAVLICFLLFILG